VVAAAHELAANAVRHGAGHGRLRLRAADGILTCQAADGGLPGLPVSPGSAQDLLHWAGRAPNYSKKPATVITILSSSAQPVKLSRSSSSSALPTLQKATDTCSP